MGQSETSDRLTQMRAVPVSLPAANRFVAAFHRHNGPLRGAAFAIAAIDSAGTVHGVAIAGHPCNRRLDDGVTLEVNRVCTLGGFNCCSFLYGCVRRAAKALGYSRLVTFTQAGEDGASLKASGWVCGGDVELWNSTWTSHPRPSHRVSDTPKQRWCITLADSPPSIRWSPECLAAFDGYNTDVVAEHPQLFGTDLADD
jgi:hypothetical protein